MNNTLITGATGFVGSHMVDYLLKNIPNIQIYATRRWRSKEENIKHLFGDERVVFEECDLIYRGRVLYPAPNNRYVIAYIKELTQKVAVQVPVRFSKTLTNKIIYIQADNTGPNAKYTWMKTPRSHNLKYYG